MGPESATRARPGKVSSLWWGCGAGPTFAQQTPKISSTLIRENMPQFILDSYSMLMLFVKFNLNRISLCLACAFWQQRIVKRVHSLHMFHILQILRILRMYNWYQTKQCIKLLYHYEWAKFIHPYTDNNNPTFMTDQIDKSRRVTISHCLYGVDRIVSSVRREHLIL